MASSSSSHSDPILEYYEEEVFGGPGSDDEEYDYIQSPLVVENYEESSDIEEVDQIFETFLESERRRQTLQFNIDVEVEEEFDPSNVFQDEMDVPSVSPVLQQDSVNSTVVQSSTFYPKPLEDLMEVDNEEMREDEARAHMLETVSPLSLPRYSRLDQVASATRRGASSSSRGGHSGRGRGSYVGGWKRGDELVQKYPSDEEFPPQLVEEIGQVLARRDRNTRNRNERRPECVSEEEELFYEIDRDEFKWEGMDGWRGEKERFLRDTVGPSRQFADPYDAFRAFWNDDILGHIVEETNRYANEIKRTSARFARLWYDTNVHEILVLFTFWMMIGIIKMPSIRSCFSKIPMLQTSVFRLLFKEERYWLLNRALHFARGSSDPSDPENVLYPMGPILDHLNSKFQELYTPSQNICIDESLILWKGPLAIKQYIKTKSARFGIKTYNLCESNTGYLWNFFIYIGKRTTNSSLPSSTSTVLKLIRPLLDLGHVLYLDNWFNSPSLARFLKRRKTDCVGTLRACRKDVPVSVQKVKLVEGEYMARQSGEVMVMAYQDRKRLTCISTYHDMSQTKISAKPGRISVYKPTLVTDYNQGMGGVDRLDQMLEPYLVERKQCIKWNRKLFKRLLNISIQNSRILLEKSKALSYPSLIFRLQLAEEIKNKHLPHVPVPLPSVFGTRQSSFPIGRLTERHFCQRIAIKDGTTRSKSRRKCVWCAQRRGDHNTKTSFECKQCGLALCFDFCFEEFHTIP